MTMQIFKRGLFTFSLTGLLIMGSVMPADAGGKKSPKKKLPKKSLAISKPTNVKKATGASPQRRNDLQLASQRLQQAKNNMNREWAKLKGPAQKMEAARQKFATAQKAAQGLSKESINAMPNGPEKNKAFALTRQVKFAATDLQNVDTRFQKIRQSSPSFQNARKSLHIAQQNFHNASINYAVSFEKRSVFRPVAKQPQGIRPVQQRTAQQSSQNRRAQPNVFRPPLPAKVQPQQLSAQQKRQQAQARARNHQPLPRRNIYDRVPPLASTASIVYSKLPAMNPQRSDNLNARDARGRPVGLFNAHRRLKNEFGAQQLLLPKNSSFSRGEKK